MLIIVVNLLIVLAGLASILGVDVRELPDVDRPVVSVRAQYNGASPTTMDAEVTSILEGAVARVSGIQSIESSSEENNMRLRAEFQPGYELNAAANDVREAVSRIQRELPEAIDQVLIYKADDDANPIVQMVATSTTLSREELAERIAKDIAPEFLAIEGVADVRLDGDQPRTLRVQLDPARMAAAQIAVTDIIAVMRNAQFDVPAGSYLSNDQELIVRAYASVVEPERVKELFVTESIRLGQLAEVFYAPQTPESYTLLNGRMVIGLGVVRRAGSNTIAIAQEVRQRLDAFNRRHREVQLIITSDDAVYITGALQEVVRSLGFAILCVLVVIGLFLGRLRAVLVPAITMPISLVGTLAAIWALGFSINLLTLLALVLATGLIVDDAIVVLENIQRRRSEGLAPLAAAVLGTDQVLFAVIATTATLVAVFLPIAFLPGQTGQLFREFGLVLTLSVVISSFVALTLCPLITAHLLTPQAHQGLLEPLQNALHGVGTGAGQFYFATLERLLAWPFASLMVSLLIAGAGLIGFTLLNQELLPAEDRGRLDLVFTGPDGASLAYSDTQSQKIEAILQPYQEAGMVTDITTIVGRWDKNRVYASARLKPWSSRRFSQMELAKAINTQLGQLPGGQGRIRQGSSLNIRGGGSGLDLSLLGNTYPDILDAADNLAAALRERLPEVTSVRVQFDVSQPELSFNIDRDKARDLDVPMERIAETLRVMVDEFELLDLSIEDQAVPIVLSAAGGVVTQPDDLLNVFVISRAGNRVPLGALIQVEEKGVAAELDRRAQRRAIDVDVGLRPGTALGGAMARTSAKA
ncbi:MAG: efflux RND transporter permease subunit, partial [Myxococcota bacterium]